MRSFSSRRTRNPAWPLLIAAFVVVLVVVATLQYRWIGAVSDAERQRMHASLDRTVGSFIDDVDRELTHVSLAFQPRPTDEDDLGAVLARRFEIWHEAARDPNLIAAVYELDLPPPAAPPESGHLRKLDASARRLDLIGWPQSLATLRDIIADTSVGGRFPPLVVDAIPALLIPIRPAVPGAGLEPLDGGPRPERFIVIEMNREEILGRFLPDLVLRNFGDNDVREYDLAITRTDSATPIFRSNPNAQFNERTADASWPLFAIRPGAFGGAGGRQPEARRPPADRPGGPDASPETRGGARPEPYSEGRPGPRQGPPRRPPGLGPEFRPGAPPPQARQRLGPPPQLGAEMGVAHWRLLVARRQGSLEDAVAAARRRNLAVSFLVLALLAGSLVTMAILLRRAEALARQQIEFVAGVTHELNTPLAAITSAGQNLADGIVSERGHVERYGSMIVREARRLSDMVAQILELSGIQVGRQPRRTEVLDAVALIDDAIASQRFAIDEHQIRVEKRIAPHLPPIRGDAEALVRAIGNLVSNAAKYGASGGVVLVNAEAARNELTITVEDRGPGIARADLPHVFEPFYRGAASAERVGGSGIGLALVKQIVEIHGGRVTADRPRLGGASFTIHLPAAAPQPTAATAKEPAR